MSSTPARFDGDVLRTGRRIPFRLGTLGYLIVVLLVVGIIGSLVSEHFLSVRNIENILVAASVVAILGVAQFFVVVTRGIDLSVGSIAALATVIVAVLLRQGHSAFVAVLLALLACALAGLVNGALVVFGRIAPFVVTLAMMSIARGVAFIIQVGTLIVISNSSFLHVFGGKTGAVPNPVLIAVVVAVLAAAVMRFTTVGRRLYAFGGNPEAARLSGLPVRRDQLTAYVISGLLAGLAGLVLAGRLQQGSSLVGQGYELDSIAATVVGGTSLFGGVGDPISTVVGALIIGMISNIMNLAGIQSEPQLVIRGVVILVAVFLTSGGGTALLRRGRGRRRRGGGAADPGTAPSQDGIEQAPGVVETASSRQS
ncbi:sugar ABC transporter permease [Luteimicrobium album]|uniref:Sugar ABC transporter permease n=1 Tax=Luteimicrobium album TaxID=1054550 RepID=A0ABQ6HX10_9MICO|nr:ABC transporter permease [Luteimicrobium album]GMA22895.1 sugar ABC transporter permease [Luteimicrobium album]